MSTPEGRVKGAVKKYLNEVGAWYYMPVSNGMGRSGCPDILVCYKGQFIGIETKSPGKLKNVSANQAREISAIGDSGGIAVVVDDVRQVEAVIKTVDATIMLKGSESA